MKHFLGAIIFSCASLFGSAQKDSSFVEVGMNVIPIIKNFNNSNWEVSPYMLQLEGSTGKVGLRVGLGLNSINFTELAGPTNGNVESNIDSSTVDLRFGLVLYKNFSPKWSLKYGIDGIISNSNSSRNDFFTNSLGTEIETIRSTSSKGFGVGAFLFAQYHISNHFSVGTELSFRTITSQIEIKDTNSEFPEFDSLINRENRQVGVLAPTSLFLIIRF